MDLTLDPDNLLNDLSNVLLLRSDLHTAFDDRKFILFLRVKDRFMVYILKPTPNIR